jgi:hypothetical protein
VISANPGGKIAGGRRFQEMRAKLAEDFDADLSVLENVLLDQGTNLLLRAQRVREDAHAAVKCASEARRLLMVLNSKRREPPMPTLDELGVR